MSKRMLADVLWDAANVYLCETQWLYEDAPSYKEEYSCHAFLSALRGTNWRNDRKRGDLSFLVSLGCDPGSDGFSHYGPRTCQGVRYMWLLLAMHVAEDEGITV